jgi:hypothetical protein
MPAQRGMRGATPGANCGGGGLPAKCALRRTSDPSRPPISLSLGFPRDTFWPKSTAAFLALGVVLTIASAQLVRADAALALRGRGWRRKPSRPRRVRSRKPDACAGVIGVRNARHGDTGMTLDPELVALTRRLRPFRRRLWLRAYRARWRTHRCRRHHGLLVLAIIARIIPFEWHAASAVSLVLIGLAAIVVDAVRVRPTLAEAALAIDSEEGSTTACRLPWRWPSHRRSLPRSRKRTSTPSRRPLLTKAASPASCASRDATRCAR